MLFKLLVLTTLALLSFSQPNYQERCIYYSEKDNVCNGGNDMIKVIVNVDDKERLELERFGSTTCSAHAIRCA